MVLDHVAERARPVVVAGPALQAERLVPGDVDPLDVVAVPHRIEDPVGEPQPQHVQDGLLGQEVVDAEDVALVERPRDQLVEGLGVGEVGAEGLLDDQRGVRGQARPGQRLQRGAEQHVRQRQVHGHRGGGAVERAPQVVGRGDVGRAVRQALEQRVGRLVVPVGEVGVELGAGVGPVGVVVAGVAVDGQDPDVIGQSAAPGQPHQGGKEETPGHVTAGTEDDEGLELLGHEMTFPFGGRVNRLWSSREWGPRTGYLAGMAFQVTEVQKALKGANYPMDGDRSPISPGATGPTTSSCPPCAGCARWRAPTG